MLHIIPFPDDSETKAHPAAPGSGERTFSVGDTCHIWYGSNHGGKTTQGTVVAVLDLPGWMHLNYVISVPMPPMDDDLVVRDGTLGMRKTPEGHGDDRNDDDAEGE